MREIVHISTLTELQRLANVEPLEHPLYLILRLEDIPELPRSYPTEMTYGFYTIGLKKDLQGYIEYGRRKYDFQEGMMGFTAPNQVMAYEANIAQGATGWILFFHAELLSKHSLGKKLPAYGFFDYRVDEALHLSKKEELMIEQIFQNINEEYHKPIDKHSKAVVASNLELLLTYADRFYSRQFITRNEVSNSFLSKFHQELKRYISSEDLLNSGIPSVGYFANFMHVSQNYLSDLLRELTGSSTRDHIQFQLVEKAKFLLLSTDKTITEIAFDLGFAHPSYFTRFFKKKTGVTPSAFRASLRGCWEP